MYEHVLQVGRPLVVVIPLFPHFLSFPSPPLSSAFLEYQLISLHSSPV